MTITVKLDSDLEEQLRQRAAGSGRSTSDVIRAALVAYLSAEDTSRNAVDERSAYALGRGLFGRFGATGTPDVAAQLAQNRKQGLQSLWQQKHLARGRR